MHHHSRKRRVHVCERRMAPVLLVVAAIACSSTPLEPLRSVSILLTNATCNPGPCTPMRVRAFPQHLERPPTPGGLWTIDLGIVTGASLCVVLPPTVTSRVGDGTSGGTTEYVWSTRDSVALGIFPVSAPFFSATPSTERFVPERAAGWTVVLPGDARAMPGAACTP